jgi:hypothetical protein
MVDAGPWTMPSWFIDQAEAAELDGRHVHERVAAHLTRRGYRHREVAVTDDVRAELLSAILRSRVCPHLRRGGPQVAHAFLAVDRIVCRRCLPTVMTADEHPHGCDLCEAEGVDIFTPIALHVGYLEMFLDACTPCADRLQLGAA